jgi:hypothetical protein
MFLLQRTGTHLVYINISNIIVRMTLYYKSNIYISNTRIVVGLRLDP